MNNSIPQLPSNKKFGRFFTLVFTVIALYLYSSNEPYWANLSLVVAAILMAVTVLKQMPYFSIS